MYPLGSLSDAATVAAIETRVARLTPDARRRWGTLSAPEMICHLADAFAVTLGDRPVSDASTFAQRTFVKWLAWGLGHVDRHLRQTGV